MASHNTTHYMSHKKEYRGMHTMLHKHLKTGKEELSLPKQWMKPCARAMSHTPKTIAGTLYCMPQHP